MTLSKVFLLAGAVLLALQLILLTAQPFKLNIPFFLVVLTLQFLIYFILLCRLKKEKLSEDKGNAELKIMGIIFIFSIFLRLVLLPTFPTLSDDIFRYVWDGRVQNAGLNPYEYPPNAEELEFLRDENHKLINHPAIRTVYPPLAQFIFRLGVKIHDGILTQKIIFTLFDLGIIVILFMFLEKGRRLWAVVYAWNPLCIVEFSGSGHNDSLMLFFLIGGLFLFERNIKKTGVLFLTGAFLSKFIPLVLAPWLFFKERKYFFLWILFIAAWTLPYFSELNFINGINTSSLSGIKTYTKDWVFNPSLYDWVGTIISLPTNRKIFFGLCLIIFSLFWYQKTQYKPVLYVFGCMWALLLCSPVVHPWYVLWLLPFLCFYPLFSGILWTFLVCLTYVVQIQYATQGVWQLPAWVLFVEYGIFYSIFIFEIMKGFKRKEGGKVIWWEPENSPVPIKSGAKEKLQVTIIIPALNEEKALPLVIQEIPKSLVQDIIVVDNGSTDQTKKVAMEAGARVFNEPQRGYGRAVLKGLSELKPDCNTVVILDGDHSDFPEDLARLLQPIQEGWGDLVLGSRTQAAIPGSLMPQQKFGNWLTCTLIKILFGESFRDMGPFRVIRRSTLESLNMKDQNFGWNVEMQVRALKKGFSIIETPVRYRPRIGQSKISGTLKGSVKAGIIILWSIYHYGWREE